MAEIIWEGGGSAKGLIRDAGVNSIVDCGDEVREVDMESVVVPYKATAFHKTMGAKGVEWNTQ